VALAAAVLSAAALYLSRKQLHAALKRAQADREEQNAKWSAALDALSSRVDALGAEIRDLGDRGAATPSPRAACSGMNLTKRAQALRMHRRGDPPDQIAAVLGAPFQEVDLLLKVHRIVMSSI
jgi:hypothetical protein